MECLRCVLKHIGAALVLMQESRSAEYGHHRWIAIGHLCEAEREAPVEWKETLRDLRISLESPDASIGALESLLKTLESEMSASLNVSDEAGKS